MWKTTKKCCAALSRKHLMREACHRSPRANFGRWSGPGGTFIGVGRQSARHLGRHGAHIARTYMPKMRISSQRAFLGALFVRPRDWVSAQIE